MWTYLNSHLWAFAALSLFASLLHAIGAVYFPFGIAVALAMTIWLDSNHERRCVDRYKKARQAGGMHLKLHDSHLDWEGRMEDHLNGGVGKFSAAALIISSFVIVAMNEWQ